eukprot:1349524-Amorphochlora_amoeboformis.AAC.2
MPSLEATIDTCQNYLGYVLNFTIPLVLIPSLGGRGTSRQEMKSVDNYAYRTRSHWRKTYREIEVFRIPARSSREHVTTPIAPPTVEKPTFYGVRNTPCESDLHSLPMVAVWVARAAWLSNIMRSWVPYMFKAISSRISNVRSWLLSTKSLGLVTIGHSHMSLIVTLAHTVTGGKGALGKMGSTCSHISWFFRLGGNVWHMPDHRLTSLALDLHRGRQETVPMVASRYNIDCHTVVYFSICINFAGLEAVQEVAKAHFIYAKNKLFVPKRLYWTYMGCGIYFVVMTVIFLPIILATDKQVFIE